VNSNTGGGDTGGRMGEYSSARYLQGGKMWGGFPSAQMKRGLRTQRTKNTSKDLDERKEEIKAWRRKTQEGSNCMRHRRLIEV